MAVAQGPLFKIREDLAPSRHAFLWVASVALTVLVWVLLTLGEDSERAISPLILPGPLEVLAALGPLHWKFGLARAVVASLLRVTVGFVVAAALAIPLGILMGAFTRVGAFVEPLALFGGYIPVVTLIPLTLSWFGIGETQKVGFLVIGIFVFLLPLVVKTIETVDDVYLNTGYTLGADRWQTLRFVLVPVAMSRIYSHLRLLYGVGWGYIILAEMNDLGSPGLGALIQLAQRRSHTDQVFAVLGVIVVIAVVVDKGLKVLGRAMFPYEEEL